MLWLWVGVALRGLTLESQWGWLATTITIYLGLCWLLGTYTCLRSPRRSQWELFYRQSLTVIVTMGTLAMAAWLLNPPIEVWVLWRSTQLFWLLPTGMTSFVARDFILNSTAVIPQPGFFLIAPHSEASHWLRVWQSTPTLLTLKWQTPDEVLKHPGPAVVAIASSALDQARHSAWYKTLEARDPRLFVLTTPLALTEKYLARIPPSLLPEPWASYDSIPFNASFGFQRQLKRVADISLSILLLIVSAPVLLMAALLIWMEDRGPVLFVQRRSGFLEQPFDLLKLRTMTCALDHEAPSWTQRGDLRITRVGRVLRRFRLDEIPQLLNVIRGDMSLIGPRPERPELEEHLELCIPHYRKRHWMQPGLSGWAQVLAPYASSVEESELKLSYDLYYIKHFSLWLDFVIMMRTIKTVIRAAGR
jgi:lipopolysaccharide/colanic/teichoic acid biosynthesis glycosyltransferase